MLSSYPGEAVGFCCSIAAMLAAVACGSVASPATPSSNSRVADSQTPGPRRIVVLGDSLAVSPNKSSAFPALLQERLDSASPGWTVSNEGIGGDTTAGGLRRVDAVLAADTKILVLELGANDGLRAVPIATIEANLAAIIERARARDIAVLLCGMETPPLHGWDYTVEYHRLFPRLAARYQLPLVPFLLEGVALNPELNGGDGIHPNAAGAQRIADTVWPHLRPLVTSTALLTQVE
jgi:acyl-CoA thioesterase-1